MKLEISLIMRTSDEVRAGQVAAIAILSVLPEIAAELAIEEWNAMRGKAQKAEEASENQDQDPLNFTTEKFQFAGRLFSAHRRGPRAAVDHAIKIIAECATIEALESRYPEIHDLESVLQHIGRIELADLLYARVADRRKELAASEASREPLNEAESDGEDRNDD